MNKKDTQEILGALAVVTEGVDKLASFASKTASAPEPDKQVLEQADRVAAKLAGLGYGTKSDIEANAAAMSQSHSMALQAAEDILDSVVAPSVKEGASPSALGQPADSGQSKPKTAPAYRPPRC